MRYISSAKRTILFSYAICQLLGLTAYAAPAPEEDIGVVGFKYVMVRGEGPKVAEVFPGSPAAKANMFKGDYILQVDGQSTKNLNKDQVYKLIVGKPETSVKLTLRRDNGQFEIVLTRMHATDFAKTNPEVWKLYTPAK